MKLSLHDLYLIDIALQTHENTPISQELGMTPEFHNLKKRIKAQIIKAN